MNKTNIKPELMTTIGVLADFLGIHQRTLRIYEEKGILHPTRTPKNRRLYNPDDINQLEFILFLTRNLAINMAGVKIIMLILKKHGIKSEYQLDYVSEIAKLAEIDKEMQEFNLRKSSRKGRKKKNII